MKPLIAGAAVVLFLLPGLARAQKPDRWTSARTLMVESEVATAGVKHPAILAAMRLVPRHEFVPDDVRQYAYYDMALPIGERQTISPPFIVAWMTAQLEPRSTDKVLEVGTGSGYHAAVISRLVSEIYSIEINPVLAKRAAQTFRRLRYGNIQAKHGDGYEGWAEHAPFDKIIVTCSPEKVPAPLVSQLKEGGRIVIPLGERYQQTLYVLAKRDGEMVVESREPTFFVPMTGEAENRRAVTSDEPLTPLVNGDFEELLEPGKPAGWYYLRQATLVDGGAGDSGRALAFSTRVAGRNAQALQAVGVDGELVGELIVELSVKAKDIEAPGRGEEQGGGMVLVSFFNENRTPLGQQVVGPWHKSFDWKRQVGHVAVPPKAAVAIVAVGILNATGELSADQISIRPVDRVIRRTATR